jgi:sporulation protein YlmC with PRC-barrel domain
MKKIGIFSILALAFSLFLSGSVLAGMQKDKEGKKAAINAEEFLGKSVMDEGGKSIGTISSFQTDEDGTIRFVILAAEEQEYFVPFGAFRPSAEGDALILTVDESLLVTAPVKTPDMSEDAFSRELYEHYGVSPYWDDAKEY